MGAHARACPLLVGASSPVRGAVPELAVRYGPDVLSVGTHDKDVWESGSAGLRKGDPLPIGRERVGEDFRPGLEMRDRAKPTSVRTDEIDLRLCTTTVIFVRAKEDELAVGCPVGIVTAVQGPWCYLSRASAVGVGDKGGAL